MPIKLPAYLWLSRHGIFYIRIKLNGSDVKRSLRTRDPKAAYIVAYQLGVLMSRRDDALRNALRNFSNGRHGEYGIAINPQTGITVNTDGSAADHQNAMEALHLLIQSGINNRALTADQAPPPVVTDLHWKLGESIKDFWVERSSDFKQGTVRTYKSSLNKLRNGLGEDAQLSSINSQVFVNWRDSEDKRLSPDTVSRDCLAYRAFFDWAINRQRFAGVNPIEDAKLSKGIRHQRIEEHKREHLPFDLSDLNKIFNPQTYDDLYKPCSYWLPLLALYTGARLNELASIELEDIQPYQSDKYAFKIRTGKTISSARVVPIHSDLIDLGFIKYVEDIKTIWKNARFLFPYLKAGSKNGLGNLPGRDFSKFKTNIGLGKDKVFHSFRKTLITCLQTNGCSAEHRKLYVGHADGRKDVHQTVYSMANSNPEAIANLVFQYLDYQKYLKFLVSVKPYKGGRFNNYLLRMQRQQDK